MPRKAFPASVAAVCLVLLTACSQDPAKSFEKKFAAVLGKEVDWTEHYGDEIWKHVPGHFNKWRKTKSRIYQAGTSYDVRASDSLITPIVALVNFQRESASSPLCATKAEAEASGMSEWKASPQDKCRVQYGYQDGKWILKQAEFYSDSPASPGWKRLSQEWIKALDLDGIDLSESP